MRKNISYEVGPTLSDGTALGRPQEVVIDDSYVAARRGRWRLSQIGVDSSKKFRRIIYYSVLPSIHTSVF